MEWGRSQAQVKELGMGEEGGVLEVFKGKSNEKGREIVEGLMLRKR